MIRPYLQFTYVPCRREPNRCVVVDFADGARKNHLRLRAKRHLGTPVEDQGAARARAQRRKNDCERRNRAAKRFCFAMSMICDAFGFNIRSQSTR